MLRNHLERMQSSNGSEASCHDTRQGDQNREPAPPTRSAYLRPKSQSTTVYHTETILEMQFLNERGRQFHMGISINNI